MLLALEVVALEFRCGLDAARERVGRGVRRHRRGAGEPDDPADALGNGLLLHERERLRLAR